MTPLRYSKLLLTLTMTLSGLSVWGCRKPFEDIMRNGYRTQCDFSYRNQAPQARPTKVASPTPTKPQTLNNPQHRRLQILKNQIIRKINGN